MFVLILCCTLDFTIQKTIPEFTLNTIKQKHKKIEFSLNKQDFYMILFLYLLLISISIFYLYKILNNDDKIFLSYCLNIGFACLFLILIKLKLFKTLLIFYWFFFHVIFVSEFQDMVWINLNKLPYIISSIIISLINIIIISHSLIIPFKRYNNSVIT